MTFTIKRFFWGMFVAVIGVMYVLFYFYFNVQRHQTAEILWNSLRNEIGETAYILSKSMTEDPKAITSNRAILDRKAANLEYVSAIAVFNDDTLLVTTDPAFRTMPSAHERYLNPNFTPYEWLFSARAISEAVVYYEGLERKSYTVVFFFDQTQLRNYFLETRRSFFIWFLLMPVSIAFLAWLMLRATLMRPLELLRQFAYYQSAVPPKFYVRELEAVRASMVQTYRRLDQEKAQLYALARTDALSGLSNRNHLEERMKQVIADSERHYREFALLFLDLDNFKSVNDSLGHDVGDELLKMVASEISDVLRSNDIVARIGGDEFVIVVTEYENTLRLTEIIERIQTRIRQPWEVLSYPIHVSSSIGIALYPKDGGSLVSLMKHADIAMYKAKENGRSQYSFYTQELNAKTQELIELSHGMKEGLRLGEYVLYYQPISDTSTGTVVGAEALIRWHHPSKGVIAPATFIPLAEQNGFIIELGSWVVQTALAQKKAWEEQGVTLGLSINVAPKQLLHANFLPHFLAQLEDTAVDPRGITIEITEYIFLDNCEKTLALFSALKSRGINIALDDFGTGYSSLSYIKAFPIDRLKIDKAFIDDYHSHDGAIFLETIVKMAQTLHLEVVAEGVETQAQRDFLKGLSCDYYQGYLCSKPLVISEFEKLPVLLS